MNSKQILFSAAALLFGVGLCAQKSKTYKETFNVGDEAILHINTNYADIEFETWDKNQVEIEAIISLEDATDEEAKEFFEEDPIKIMGNSKEIEVKTINANSWGYRFGDSDFDFDFDFSLEPIFEAITIPDLPEIAVLPEMPALPPMPPISFKSFDYSKYQEDGEKYLKEWAESFEESFDEDYQEKMEEWGKRMEERAKRWEERNADRLEEMEKRVEERAAEMEKRMAEREKRRAEQEKIREKAIKKRYEAQSKLAGIRGRNGEDAPNVFYFSSDGEHKKYEVKKTIKIRMPKSVKLKMNVKHGEVKLAANTRQINASLRYASLLASDISGEYTNIEAAYSPVVIERWNAGNLSTKYSDKVKLARVKDLKLNSTSSNVTIDKVLNDVYIVNDLGNTVINSVDDNFKSVYISLKNGQLNAALPKATCNINIVDRLSDISYPKTINANVVKTAKGYEIQGAVKAKKSNNPTFGVNAEYSEVVIKE